MKARRLVLIPFAILALSLCVFGVASAATRGQSAPQNADAPATATPADDGTVTPSTPAYLGLQVTNLTDRVRQVLGVSSDIKGLVVTDATASSPADEAGLQRADIILSIDGNAMTNPSQLRSFLRTKAAGDVVDVQYYRNGTQASVSVTLGALPPSQRPLPAWLGKLHVFVRAFPNAVDGTLRVADQSGQVKTYVVSVGDATAVDDSSITVQNAIGEVTQYQVLDTTVFVKGGHTVAVSDIQPGDHVAVLTVDGDLRAVVVLGPEDQDGGAKPNDLAARIQAKMDEQQAKLQQRQDDLKAKMEERFANQREKLQQRIDQAMSKLGHGDDNGQGQDS